MPSKWIGCIHRGQVGKRWVRGKKPIGTIPRTSHVMPEDQNTTCGCRLNSQRNQPKKIGHLRSRELDYPRRAQGQDNS